MRMSEQERRGGRERRKTRARRKGGRDGEREMRGGVRRVTASCDRQRVAESLLDKWSL